MNLIKHSPRQIIYSIIFILGLAAATHLPSINNEFTNWNDGTYLYSNPAVKELSLNNIRKMFSSFVDRSRQYVPLTILSFAVEYHFYGLDPVVYHLHNLGLHVFNTVFVFFFIYFLTSRLAAAFIVAMFFGIHPVQVETVVWISSRRDLLYSFFYIPALIFYVLYVRAGARDKWFYRAALGLHIFSLFSKPAAVMFPAGILLIDYFFKRRMRLNVFLEKVPFLLLSLSFWALTLLRQAMLDIEDIAHYSVWERVLYAGYVLGRYLGRAVAPVKLSAFYPYPQDISDIRTIGFYFSILMIIISVYGLLKTFRHHRYCFFGLAFFLIHIFLNVQLVPKTDFIMSDHYMYIAMIGVLFILGQGYSDLIDQVKGPGIPKRNWFAKLEQCNPERLGMILPSSNCNPEERQYRKGLAELSALAIVIAAVIFSDLSLLRCHVWKDSITLWSDALEKYPKESLIYVNRGRGYSERGQYLMALNDYDRAINLDPQSEKAYNNRGVIYGKQGYDEKALSDFDQVIFMNPENSQAFNNKGMIYYMRQQYHQALQQFDQAIGRDRFNAVAYFNRGNVYKELRQWQQALADYDQALSLDVHNSEWRQLRKEVLGHLGLEF